MIRPPLQKGGSHHKQHAMMHNGKGEGKGKVSDPLAQTMKKAKSKKKKRKRGHAAMISRWLHALRACNVCGVSCIGARPLALQDAAVWQDAHAQNDLLVAVFLRKNWI